MRLTRHQMVLVLVFASVGLTFTLTGVGCSPRPLSQWEHENVDTLPLRPEWQPSVASDRTDPEEQRCIPTT